MKCVECVDYAECSKKYNLTIKRKHCPVAKVEYVQTNADRIRAMSDDELAGWLARTQIANVAEALAVAKIPYELEDGLKDEVAKECLEWLKQPAKGE